METNQMTDGMKEKFIKKIFVRPKVSMWTDCLWNKNVSEVWKIINKAIGCEVFCSAVHTVGVKTCDNFVRTMRQICIILFVCAFFII